MALTLKKPRSEVEALLRERIELAAKKVEEISAQNATASRKFQARLSFENS